MVQRAVLWCLQDAVVCSCSLDWFRCGYVVRIYSVCQKSDTLLVFELYTLVRCITWWFLLGVSRMGKTGIIFIELGALACITVNVLLVKDCCLISEPSVVSTDGLSSRMVHHRTLQKTCLGCTAALQGGHTEHITVWIGSSECWNCSNSVNIWCFAVYMTVYWCSWQGCHFLAHCVHYICITCWSLMLNSVFVHWLTRGNCCTMYLWMACFYLDLTNLTWDVVCLFFCVIVNLPTACLLAYM